MLLYQHLQIHQSFRSFTSALKFEIDPKCATSDSLVLFTSCLSKLRGPNFVNLSLAKWIAFSPSKLAVSQSLTIDSMTPLNSLCALRVINHLQYPVDLISFLNMMK